MELVPKAGIFNVTRASSKAWIPELIAAAHPEVTETYRRQRRENAGRRLISQPDM
jgi:hypothetical protein